MKNPILDEMFAPLNTSMPAPLPGPYRPEVRDDGSKNIEMARLTWREAVKISDTIVEKYLRERRHITLDPLPVCLRFHPTCYHGPTRRRYPAMIGLMTDAITNKPCGIHRTFLNADGTGKADIEPAKMMLGAGAGAVVRLSPDDEVTMGLGVSEGIETGLSVLSIGWRPVWASMMSANLSSFPVLGGIDALTIFADHDAPGVEAAQACAKRWAAAGKEVIIRKPFKSGDDWNDAAKETQNV